MNEENELVYRGDNTLTYAMSVAATWIWAPAIYVASSMAYFNGLYGFLWFVLPNTITLAFFGFFAQRFVLQHDTTTFTGITNLFTNKKQEVLHSIVSGILLICSSCVQIIGLHHILQMYFNDVPLYVSAIVISMFCYAYTKIGGIKACIISDKYKYITMLVIGLILLTSIFCNTQSFENITFFGVNKPEFIDISLSFGIVSSIGLLTAPYVDNTLWQRVYSTNPSKVMQCFLWSAVFFIVIPIIFGCLGFLSTGSVINSSWVVTDMFKDNLIMSGMISVAIFLALVATLDSNLCAVYSLAKNEVQKISKYSMELLLCVSSLIVICLEPTIVEMFLIYGTIRTAIAVPTILVIYQKFDEDRLFYATLSAVIIGFVGYMTMAMLNLPYGFVFTCLALSIPLCGYKK